MAPAADVINAAAEEAAESRVAGDIFQPSAKRTAGGRRWWIAVALALAVLAIFGRSARYDFVAWDDNYDILENERLCRLDLGYFWRQPYLGNYRPVQWLWFGMETYLSGRPDPNVARWRPSGQVFHVGKLALHVLCGWAVWRLLRRLTRDALAAGAGALLFVVHPLQTESVVWNADLGPFCALLTLCAIDLYLTATTDADAGRAPPSRGRRALCYFLSLAFLAAALLTKQLALAGPLTLAAIELLWRRRGRRALVSMAPWLIVALGGAVVAKLVQPDSQVLDLPLLWQRPLIAGDALAFYLQKLVWPVDLSLDYAATPRAVLASGRAYYSWLLPAVAVALLGRWNRRWAWTAAALFVAGLAPSLGLIPFYAQNMSTVADRYAYLAMLGPALACAALLAGRPPVWVWVAMAVALSTCAADSAWQVGYWRDSETLLRHVVDVAPRSFIGQTNLSGILYKQNRLEEATQHVSQALQVRPDHFPTLVSAGAILTESQRYDEAAAHLTRAVELQPVSALAHANLALALIGQRRLSEARVQAMQACRLQDNGYWPHIALARVAQAQGDAALAEHEFQRAAQLDPDSFAAYFGLAELRDEQGRLEEALKLFDRALEIVPRHSLAMLGRADCLSRLGLWDAAAAEFDRLLPLEAPPAELWLRWAAHLQRQGRLAESLTAARRAAQQWPALREANTILGRALLAVDDAALGVALLRQVQQTGPLPRDAAQELAWTLATHPDPAVRSGAEALETIRRALADQAAPSLTELDTLAVSYAAAGEFEQAVLIGQRTLAAAEQAGNAALASDLRRRVELFQAQRPFVAQPPAPTADP